MRWPPAVGRCTGSIRRAPSWRRSSQALRRLPRRNTRRAAALARRRESVPRASRPGCASWPPSARGRRGPRRGGAAFNAGGEGESRLRRLLDAQVYRLVHWRRAAREINYRRFFDVNDLVALHMEDPEVFAQTHALVLEWRRRGWVDGFRIDHPDGLLDPLGYFERLAAAAFPEHAVAPPVCVEKILSHGERLRAEWPVAGTTGYDFLNQAEALFIDPAGLCGASRATISRIIRQPLGVSGHRRGRGSDSCSRPGSRPACAVWRIGCSSSPGPAIRCPPCRARISSAPSSRPSSPCRSTAPTWTSRSPVPGREDRRLLEGALAEARTRGRSSAAALDLLESGAARAEGPDAARLERFRLRFVERFQQLSGPATAKGVEDTAFYAYAPLLSRNEVGGGPEAAARRAPRPTFHAANALPRRPLAGRAAGRDDPRHQAHAPTSGRGSTC